MKSKTKNGIRHTLKTTPVRLNLTAVKTLLTAVKTKTSGTPRPTSSPKYKFLKVQMSRARHVNNTKVRIHLHIPQSTNSAPPSPTTDKMDSSKTKTRARHVTRKVRIPTKYKGHKVQMSCTRQTSPGKYKFHKVQISCLRHVTCKVRIPTKYKFHKVQISCGCSMTSPTKYKPQVSCFSYVPAPRIAKPHSTVRASLYCKINIQKARLAYRNKHTPYGPYNLPHMVLCTKQGPDNA